MEPVEFLTGHGFRRSEETVDVINPYTKGVVKKIYRSGKEDVNIALDYLAEAFEEYRKVPVYVRSQMLYEIAKRINRKREDFTKLIILETGKPKWYAKLEVDRAILTFRLGIEESKRIPGEVLDLDLLPGSEGKTGIVKRFPLGTILAITPWNFPLNLVAHKISPALASGNVVLLKPASASLTCGIELTKIIYEVSKDIGLKHCPVNVITSSGKDMNEVIKDERIAMVSFTGSHDVGWALKDKVGKKKISLELGGNAGVIVEDTEDLNQTAQKIALGGFGQAGQSCISVQRIFVNKKLADDFKNILTEETSRIKFGDPFDIETVSGPMISEDEAKRIEQWVNESKGNSAKVLIGGVRDGAVYSPTVIADAAGEDKVNSEEVFAPVVSLSVYEDFNDAITQVNDTKYGLQAGVFTSDIQKAFYAFNEIECGGVIINDVPTYRMDSMPYGGMKDSGNSREGVKYAVEEMTERKVMVITEKY